MCFRRLKTTRLDKLCDHFIFSMYKGSVFGELREQLVAIMNDRLSSEVRGHEIIIPGGTPVKAFMPKSQAIKQTIDGVRSLLVGPSGDVCSMFSCEQDGVDNILPILDSMYIAFSPDDDGETRIDLGCVANNHWPEFLCWILKTHTDSEITLKVLSTLKLLVCAWFDARNAYIWDYVVPFLWSEDGKIALTAMSIVERIFTVSEEHQKIVVSDSDILGVFLGHVKHGSDLLARESLLVLQHVFICCHDHPEAIECISPEFCGNLVAATFRHMDRLRTTSENAMKLLRAMCLTECFFFLAVEHGLINKLLAFMVVCGNTKSGQIIKSLYELLYVIVTETQNARIETNITEDSRFFSSIQRLLASALQNAKVGATRAIFNVMGAVLSENMRELYEAGVFDTCLEFIDSMPLILEKYALSMMMVVLDEACSEVRLQMATPTLVGEMCKILEAEDARLAVQAANCLARLLETQPAEFSQMLEEEGIDDAVTALMEASEEGEAAGQRLNDALAYAHAGHA